MRRSIVLVFALGLPLVTVGCKDTKGCGPKLDELISQANAAIRDKDAAAMREAAEKIKQHMSKEGATVATMAGVHSSLRELADAQEAASGGGDTEQSNYQVAVAGFDSSVNAAMDWCSR